ncbi:MAG: aminotransferase class IV [Aminivibrio sp.]|jgi:branched-chain amino acid aminotransferase
MTICYFSGKFTEGALPGLPLSDLALHRGIAVYDIVRIYGGRPFAMGRSLKRLSRSAALCRMEMPLTDDEIASVIREGAARTSSDGLAKIFLTGGDIEDDGIFPSPRLFALFSKLEPIDDAAYSQGLALSLLPREREFFQAMTINYLVPFVNKTHGTYGPLHCPEGEITEAATANFFAVAGDNIITAPDHRVLQGVTREIVIETARENGMHVETRCLSLEELPHITEAFITESALEIAPVVRIGDHTVGSGSPGPVTERLAKLFREAVPTHLD